MEGELSSVAPLGTGLPVARHWGHGERAAVCSDAPRSVAGELHRAGREFAPAAASRSSREARHRQRAGRNRECLAEVFNSCQLGEHQPGGPAPASQAFRPAAKLETLFVFLPGQPAMIWRWQLLQRARDGNTLGSGQASGHPHPPPAPGNGSQRREPTQPRSTEIGAKLCYPEVREDTVLLHGPALTSLS